MEKLSGILLVDDDPTTNYLHKRLLESYQVAHRIEIANDGEEAIQLITNYLKSGNEDKLPKVVFVDIDMPFMDGFQFLETYKDLDFSSKDSVVVAVLTSSISQRDKKRAREFPIDAFFVKPLTKDKVMELMADHFGWEKSMI